MNEQHGLCLTQVFIKNKSGVLGCVFCVCVLSVGIVVLLWFCWRNGGNRLFVFPLMIVGDAFVVFS